MFLYNGARLNRELEVSASDLLTHVTRNWDGYTATARKNPKLDLVFYSDGLDYLNVFHMILYEAKAFLDMLTPALCITMNPAQTPIPGFRSGKFGGKKIPGGRFLNWISSHVTSQQSDALRAILARHIEDWVGEAVSHRDRLAHFRDIEGMRHMCIPVSGDKAGPDAEDLLYPIMPNGDSLTDYVDKLSDRLGTLLDDVLALIPIQHELVNGWAAATKALN